MKKKTIIVTGGLGFIGSNLIKKLEIIYRIIIIDNKSSNKKEYYKLSKNILIYNKDIKNKIKLDNKVNKIFALIHLAASGSVIDSIKYPSLNFINNAYGTFQILELCKKLKIKKIIFASTGGAIMGRQIPPIHEKKIPRPISPYGASKLAGEAYCSAYSATYNMSITVLRFSNIIGPYSWHKKGIITKFFKAILKNKPVVVYGNGKSSRDYLFVDDLCWGITKVLKNKTNKFDIFHLASGKETSINLLLKKIKIITKIAKIKVINKNARKGEVDRNFSSNNKAKKYLNFKPKHSLDKGLLRTWNWFKEYSKKN
tara:strand:+ start:266 stop:1204 length:939 start_codon:yes stop_codon:yes gene_type:complete